MAETLTVCRKRLIYQSRYRGRLESDLFFGRFADAHLPRLHHSELERYEALLRENDHDLFAWISGHAPVPPRHDHEVFALLRNFTVATPRR
jgi:antitoxin CptB